MRRILFVGEGSTDVGLERTPVRLWLAGDTDGPDEGKRRGVVPVLVLRALREGMPGAAVEMEAVLTRTRRMHGRGFARKVKAAMVDAQAAGLDGVVFVIDRDGGSGRARLSEMRDGRAKGEADGFAVPTVLGMAIEMLEAWLLADETALNHALGITLPGALPDPEGIADPKAKLNEVDDPAKFAGDAVARDEAIAEATRLNVVCKRCPRGFRPFHDEVVQRLGPLFGS